MGCLLGIVMWRTGLPGFAGVWLGLLVSGCAARPPQPRSGRRSDPVDPRDEQRYRLWKATLTGLKPGKAWLAWRRVAWWVGVLLGLPFMGMLATPLLIPVNALAGFMSVMGLAYRWDRRRDRRHPYTGVSVTAFQSNAPLWKRLVADIPCGLMLAGFAVLAVQGCMPWGFALGAPPLACCALMTLLDRGRQSKQWKRQCEWQETLDQWVQSESSPMAKAWDGATVSQVSVLGDAEDPLTVIRIRLPQGNQTVLKQGVGIVTPLATPEGWNLVELLNARHGNGFDPNAVRLVLAHDSKAVPDITKPCDERLATLVTDIAYARAARTWRKRAPLTKAHPVSGDPGKAAWLITLDRPPEGGEAPDLISLNWLADTMTGPAATIGMPVEADLYDAYHLAARSDTPLSDEGNKWRPKGMLTSDKSFQAYVDLSRRYRDTQTMWASLIPAKLKPPTPAYDLESTQEGDGWSLTVTPLSFQPPATAVDYAKIDLQRLDPEASFIGISPNADGSGDLIRVKGNAPTTLDTLTGGQPQQRYYAKALVYRALVNALPASKGTVTLGAVTQEGKGDNAIWRATVETGDGATVADLRKHAAGIQAQVGAAYLLWDWRSASQATLWFMRERLTGVEDANRFRQRRRQKELLPLMLSDSWGVAGVQDASGRTPKVVDLGVFPRNHQLLRVRFRIPAGLGLARVDANQDKFLTAAGYGYGRILPRGDEHGADMWDMALSKGSPFPTMVKADWDWVRGQDTLTLPIGVDDMGEPVAWNVHDTYHIAVMGKSGTGKSSAAQVVVADALIHGWQVIIIDPSKGAIDFTQWAKPLALAWVGNGQLDETEAVIRWTEDEMNKRVRMLSGRGVGNVNDLPDGERPPRILIVFDELNGYLTKMGKTASNPNRDIAIANDNARIQALNNSITRTMSALSKIALQGRTAGISLLLGGQRLGVKDFEKFPGGNAFYRTLGRLLLGNDAPEGIISASNIREAHRQQEGMKGEGGQVPKGRGLWEDMDGRMTCVQTWYGGGQEALAEAVAGVPKPTPIDYTPFMPEKAATLGEVTKPAEQAVEAEERKEREIDRKVEDAEEISVDWGDF